ncbi:MAG: NAD(P)-dependent alcohol dehydrogenase [Methanoculleus sp.]
MKGLARITKGEIGWVEKEKPVAGPRDAIVRPLALAPCSSELHMIWGDMGDYMPSGRIMGHEAAGVVDEVGKEVRDFKPGDRVIVPAITPNYLRVPSQRGFAQHCDGMASGMPFCTQKDGTFAEYFHVNDADAQLALIPDGVSLEQAVMIGDMVTTGFHGAEMANVQLGSTVAVFGIGPVGLMAVAGAHLLGAARILAVGSRPNAVKVAKEYGATEIIDYHNGDTVKQIMDLTDGAGVDAAVTAGGGVETIGQAIEVLQPGGTLGNINAMEHAESIPIPLAAWGAGLGNKTIKGDVCPGGRARMERLAALVKAGRIDPGRLITHRFTNFEDIEEALLLMHEKPKNLIKPAVILE